MKNVYFNDESINCFDTVEEAYEFACAIENNDISEHPYQQGSDYVSFDGNGEITDTLHFDYKK